MLRKVSEGQGSAWGGELRRACGTCLTRTGSEGRDFQIKGAAIRSRRRRAGSRFAFMKITGKMRTVPRWPRRSLSSLGACDPPARSLVGAG